MNKKKFLITAILTFCFISIPHMVLGAEIPNKTINVLLDHSNTSAPSIISVSIENQNPEQYQLVLTDHFYTVKQIDEANNILFEGQVKRYKLDTVNGNDIEVPENPLEMYLPYFDEVKKIQIFDENALLVLEIDLGQYSIGPTPTSAPRYADCNKCGYCKNKKPPQDLNQCMKCIYPDYVGNPEGTLKVDPKTNKTVSPRTGSFYSQLGCIDVGIAGFRDPAASGGVLNVILARLLFPITGGLALIALIYGAFLVMTAQKDPGQLERGKKWIYGALIGVVFTFCVILLIRIIGGDLLKIPGLDI